MATARLLILVLASHYSVSLAALETRYSNSFAVGVQGGTDKADEIAAKHGFINMGPVSISATSSSMLLSLIDW